MKTLSNKLTMLAAGIAMAAPSAYAEFQLAEGLTMTGFMDMSYSAVDPDGGETESSAGLDQFEITLTYNFDDKLSAVVDVEYHDNGNGEGEETHVEQAYINYALTDTLSITAGRFLSYSGWETEDPTGLFQFSGTGYAKYFYGAYQQGVSLFYGTDSFSLAMSVVNDLGTLTGDTRDAEDPAVELMAALTPTDAWTLKAFYMLDKHEVNGEDIEQINVWTSYAVGGLTLAAEVNSSENNYAAVGIAGDDAEAEGYLLMANYSWGKFGLTARYHGSEVETAGGVTVEDITAFTLAPSYAVTDNLLLVAEYRMDEEDVTGAEWDSYALEALLTF